MNLKYNYKDLVEHYNQTKNQRKTAEAFGIDYQYLNKILQKMDIKNLNDKRGNKNSNWRGGIISDGHGRTLIWIRNHPNPSHSAKSHVYEYRLIMEKKIGRILKSKEIVHHIDGNCNNNHVDNLKIMSQKEHCKLHDEKDNKIGKKMKLFKRLSELGMILKNQLNKIKELLK